MKIEIGESIVYSWLKHVKKCKIVQLNWKVSESWDNEENRWKKIKVIFKKINQEFDNILGDNLEQLIKQAEIDVVGVNEKEIYGVDVAFHINGLRYSNNVRNITKKMFRTLLIFELYFSSYEKNIFFVTPKVTPKELENIKLRLNEIKYFVEKEDLNISFEFIYNSSFKDKILNELIKFSNDIADTSELFLRSYQLLNLFDNEKKDFVNYKNNKSRYDLEENIENEIEKVKSRVPRWFKHKDQINSKILITFLELSDLNSKSISKEYLKAYFKKNYPNINFEKNYNQMKNFGEKNHAKVFEEEKNFITLWKPVSAFIVEEYKKLK
ncbi:MAG: hypothetical protein ABGX26_00970 [Nautiliaceae bacterium]